MRRDFVTLQLNEGLERKEIKEDKVKEEPRKNEKKRKEGRE